MFELHRLIAPLTSLAGRLLTDKQTRRRLCRSGRRAQRLPACEKLEIRRLLVAEGDPFNVTRTVDTSGLVGEVSSTIRWGDGTESDATVDTTGTQGRVQIEFRFDQNDPFFNGANIFRQSRLQLAADAITDHFNDDLDAIVPTATNGGWTAVLIDPQTNRERLEPNLNVGENTIVVFAGSRELGTNNNGDDILGLGGPGGFLLPDIVPQSQAQLDEINAFRDAVTTRGEMGTTGTNPTDQALWGGAISFDTTTDWHFGLSEATLGPDQLDFISVASHELAHLLGFGALNPIWERFASTGVFTGPNAKALNGGQNVRLDANRGHFSRDFETADPVPLMIPEIEPGQRVLLSPLDLAALDDIGWDVVRTTATINGTHQYADNGVFPVEVVVKGSRFGELIQNLSADVTNVAPTLTVVGAQSVARDQPLNIANIGTIVDPGFRNTIATPPTVESFIYAINWGDGSELDSGTATIDRHGTANGPTIASFDGSHVYTTTGDFTVRVNVADDDGGAVQRAFVVTVTGPPLLSLELDRNSITENDGNGAATLTVRRSGPVIETDQTIMLESSDTSEAAVLASVVIPAGESSTTTSVFAIDDSSLDGEQTVQLSASGVGLDPGTIDLLVADHETLNGFFTAENIFEDSRTGVNLIILRSNFDDLDQPLDVTVTGGVAGQLQLPDTLTIPADSHRLPTRLQPANDDLPEPTLVVTFNFSAPGYVSDSASINLLDDEPPFFQNPVDRFDVNNVNGVTAGDALRIINELGRRGGATSLDPSAEQPNGIFLDPNGDYRVSALDALNIINELARRLLNQSPGGEEAVSVQYALPTLADLSDDEDDLQSQWWSEFVIIG